MQPPVTYSPDGAHWWDGRTWRPTLSPDGRLRWTGQAWVPVAMAMVPQPTAWTRPLQLATAGILLFGTLYGLVLIPLLLSTSSTLTALPPDVASTMTPADQESFRQTMQVTIAATVVSSVVVGLAWTVVLLVGCLKLWRWVFWYQMIVGFLGALGLVELPFLYAASAATSGFFGAFRLPLWTFAVSFVGDVVILALSIWMAIALRRYGTWARVRVPVGWPASA